MATERSQEEMASDRGNFKPDGMPCINASCTESIASLEHQVGKAAVKVSRLERQLRQQEQETERQKQRNVSLSAKNDRMDEKLKAMEAVVVQHMQMKDSLEKLEAPPSVLQQKLREEREKVDALQNQVQALTASSLALNAAARLDDLSEDLRRHKAFIDNYCRVTENTFRLTKETVYTYNSDHVGAIRDILRRIEDDEARLPVRLRTQVEKNMELRELSARQQGLTFSNGKITKLHRTAASKDIDRTLEGREPSIQHRESPMSVGAISNHQDRTPRNSADENPEYGQVDVRPQTSHRPSNFHGTSVAARKRNRDGGAESDVQTESCDGGDAKKVKHEDSGCTPLPDPRQLNRIISPSRQRRGGGGGSSVGHQG
jgi:uncharacterized protein YhaN